MINIISKGQRHDGISSGSFMGLLVFNKEHEIILCSPKVHLLLDQKEVNQLLDILDDGTNFDCWCHLVSESGGIDCYCEEVDGNTCAYIYSASEMDKQVKISNMYRELEKEYQVVLDHIDDAIFVIDSKGYVVKLNEAARGSRSIEEYIGVNVKDDIIKGHISHSVADTIIRNNLTQKLHMIIKYNDRNDVLSTGAPYYENGKLKFVVACERNVESLGLLQQQLSSTSSNELLYNNSNKGIRIKGLRNNILVANSEVMKNLIELTKKTALFDTTVLLIGESGVGKEIFADIFYLNSSRNGGPFIKANCGAIPESLWESEFFGYEGCSFTGADKKGKMGYFELANGGTLLLDEISEIPLNLQVKLLRVLQEKEIFRIGGVKPIPLDVRIIATSNKNLNAEVKKGNFRMDLFHRLNVIKIEIPPLHDRREDLPPLITYFLEFFNERYSTKKKLTLSAVKLLESYNWPGNIRELKNLLERLIITSTTDAIGYYDVFQQLYKTENPDLFCDVNSLTEIDSYDELNKRLLIKFMERYNNNTQMVAEALGITRSTINRRLKRYGIR